MSELDPQKVRDAAFVLAISALIAGGVFWAVWPSPDEAGGELEDEAEPAGPPPPGATLRSSVHRYAQERAGQDTGGSPIDRPNPDDTDTELRVKVILGDPQEIDTEISVFARFRPSTWFPYDTEVPFPDSEASRRLQTLVALEDDGDHGPEAFLEAAAAEGLLTEDPADPWLGLVALEARRRQMLTDFRAQFRAWADAGEQGPMPKAPYGPILALAETLDTGSEPVVAEYARIYRLLCYEDILSDVRDRERGTALGLDTLRATEDGLVAETAANLLLNLGAAPYMTADDLALLDNVWWSDAGAVAREGLARLGAQAAIGLEDAALADRWTERVREMAERECHGDPETCDYLRRDAALFRARALALAGAEAEDWRTAIILAVWTCERRGLRPSASGTGHAVWGDGWGWTSWTTDAAIAGCIADLDPRPGPDRPATLTLEITVEEP